ncbi:hypothetical protein [Halocalculus aciditolerans]|uniref:Uncharacterized protein n=1 Tax=Halocalculus aciditolerans TaxID=1383812 RepID=A0A830F233_9EURY|nr:hypothetical protein [Halocalculus aciditolerans]GGL55010.1 hypothetical protein GCM10009039_11390 [Halocalculus aciditolerans]
MSERDTDRLWKVFRAGYLESAEGWNGETYHDNPEAYERRLKARFEALNESGKFDEPLEWSVDTEAERGEPDS